MKTRFLVSALLPLAGWMGLAGWAGCPAAEAPTDASLCVDRLSVKMVPPAGLKVEFRLLDCEGNPVRQLTPGDVNVINDEKGLPFGQGGEGDSISDIGENSAVELYSVLTLDLSNSIGEGELRDAVIDGAKAFVEEVVTKQTGVLRHNVAIVAFGSPTQVTLEQDFSSDDSALNAKLEELRGSPMRGSTDLYGAYMLALDTVALKGTADAIVERFVVLMTDGTHEAGDEANRRQAALNKKEATAATVYSIGIQGNYDGCKLEELAGPQSGGGCRVGAACQAGTAPPASCPNFISDVSQADLGAAFADVADKAAALARSNYAVGICTPVAFGSPSLTLDIDVDGRTASEALTYFAEGVLTGDVNGCDVSGIQSGVLACSGGSCVVVCGGMQCGTDQGASCGTCPGTDICGPDNTCTPL